jgi:hypothetical protein
LHPGTVEAVQDGTRNFLPERLKHYTKITEELDALGLPYVRVQSGTGALNRTLKVIESFLGCELK